MGIEQNEAQHYRESPDKYIDPTAIFEMTTLDYVVRPDPAGQTTISCTLPPVAEARGRIYTILNRGDGDVLITHHDDSESWTNIRLETDEYAVLFSDGVCWFLMEYTGALVTVAPTTIGRGTTLAGTTIAPTTIGG